MTSILQKLRDLTGLFNNKTTEVPSLPVSFLEEVDEIDAILRELAQELPYTPDMRRYYSKRSTNPTSQQPYMPGVTLSLYFPENKAHEAYIKARKNYDLKGMYDYIKNQDHLTITILSNQDTSLPEYHWTQRINSELTGKYNASIDTIMAQIAKFIATTSPELANFAAQRLTNIMDKQKQGVAPVTGRKDFV